LIEQGKTWLAHHPRWAGALLALLTFVIYARTLSCQFVFDDIPQILENPFITNASFWRRIFLGSVWSFRGAGEHDNFYRPLQFVIYWLLYRANGPNPAVFHLFQLLLCAGTAWLVFLLGRELLGNDLAAWGGALLWALHPQHVETVTWVSALPDAGAACFGILGFRYFLRAEKAADGAWGRYALAALAYFPALLFKESALTLPLLVLVYWFFFPGSSTWKQKAVRWLPFGAAVAVYMAVRITALGGFSQAPEPFKFSRQILAAALGLLGQHARLFFWPVRLSAFRVFNLGPSLHSPWPWLVLLALVTAVFLRRGEPLLGFLVFWWLVTLAPCLDVRMVSFPVADRFSYMPSVGLALAVAYLLLVKLPPLFPMTRLAPALAGAVALVSIAYAVQDVRLVPTWGDNVALWDYSLRASPDSALVHLFQATLLRTRDGNMPGAEREYQTALRLNRESVRPLAGIAYECYLGLGQIALLRAHVPEALNFYQMAIRQGPDHSPAYKALGALYFPQGNYQQAEEYFTIAVKLDPQDVESRFFLGTCALKLGHPREAAAQFHAARQVDPTYIQAYEAEARALEAAGDAPEAARVRSLVAKH
jgi:tetratricopeptide (TPR) repeat protein